MPSRKPIVTSWDDWKASREAKRAILRKLGLDVPTRRTKDVGKKDQRLRAAFNGQRAPTLQRM